MVSSAAATTNTWTHLVGVYDDTANTGRFYVNGVSQGTLVHTDASEWNATGLMQAGRAPWNGGFVDAWAGKPEDVRSNRRALSATDVSAVYGDAPSIAYEFEENTGTTTTTADRSGFANTGQSPLARPGPRPGTPATPWRSTSSRPTTPPAPRRPSTPPQLHRVRVGQPQHLGAVTRTVLSQQGTNYSTVILKYEFTGSGRSS